VEEDQVAVVLVMIEHLVVEVVVVLEKLKLVLQGLILLVH
jgi:hypothetical protein